MEVFLIDHCKLNMEKHLNSGQEMVYREFLLNLEKMDESKYVK